MKKLLLIALLLCCGLTLKAQDNDGIIFPGTMYGSIGLGAYDHVMDGVGKFGAPAVNLTGGFWVSDPLAIQLSLDAMPGTNHLDHSVFFVFANTEFKWDINSTFFHIYNKNYLSPVPVYFIYGVGMGDCMDFDSASDSDYTYQMILGIQAPYRISEKTDAILQYKCFILPQRFDGAEKSNVLHTFGIGLLFRQSSEPFHRRTERYSRSKAEDWFFGLGIGPNFSAFEIFTNPNLGGMGMVGVAPEIMFGRNFSNFWTLRVQLGGLTGHEIYDTLHQQAGPSYKFSHIHTDVMFNLSSLFWRGRGVSFNIMPYFGGGPVWRYDNPSFLMAAEGGLFLRQYISSKSDIYLDMRYLMVPPRIGGSRGPSGKFYGVGLPSVTVGYIYNFGHNTTRYRIPLTELSR